MKKAILAIALVLGFGMLMSCKQELPDVYKIEPAPSETVYQVTFTPTAGGASVEGTGAVSVSQGVNFTSYQIFASGFDSTTPTRLECNLVLSKIGGDYYSADFVQFTDIDGEPSGSSFTLKNIPVQDTSSSSGLVTYNIKFTKL